MNKFSIEVNNEIESEFIQKTAFKAGYTWAKGSVDIFKLGSHLHFNSYEENRITFSDSPSTHPLYKFPSQAEEIVKLFEKEKEPELKAGQWITMKETYAGSSLKAGNVYKLLRPQGPDVNSYWIVDHAGATSFSAPHPKIFRLSTPSEIESHLIKEAEKKGFVAGAKVKTGTWNPAEILSIGYYPNLSSGNISQSMRDYESINGKHFLTVETAGFSVPITKCELLPSHPQITINGYTAKFEDWGLNFNDGCAKIDNMMFKDLKVLIGIKGKGNKAITSVKIGSGEFTASQIKEIADYYNSK